MTLHDRVARTFTWAMVGVWLCENIREGLEPFGWWSSRLVAGAMLIALALLVIRRYGR